MGISVERSMVKLNKAEIEIEMIEWLLTPLEIIIIMTCYGMDPHQKTLLICVLTAAIVTYVLRSILFIR